MNARILALGATLIAFAALTSWPLLEYGYLGFFPAAVANPAAIQVFADVAIACALILIWLVRDARRRGVSPWPYVVLTLTLGSFGPLIYLLLRELRVGEASRAPAH